MNSIPTLFETLFKFTEKLRYPHLPLVDKDFEVLVKKKKSALPFLSLEICYRCYVVV